MKIIETGLPGVVIIEADVYRDFRGFFLEAYHKNKFEQAGIPTPFVQDNHSSSFKGVLRGLHAQCRHPQAKLIRVLEGEIFDVAVDIRPSSPTFKKWVSHILSSENQHQMYVPVGFAHGFYVLSDRAEVVYKCSDYYDPSDEISVFWDDPQIGINWPSKNPILSAKDQSAPRLEELLSRLHRS